MSDVPYHGCQFAPGFPCCHTPDRITLEVRGALLEIAADLRAQREAGAAPKEFGPGAVVSIWDQSSNGTLLIERAGIHGFWARFVDYSIKEGTILTTQPDLHFFPFSQARFQVVRPVELG
jgi:hypothetical protein